MNKKELIKRIKEMRAYMFNFRPYIEEPLVLSYIKQLDEHENGRADEAPRYVKNILARLRELPLHDREVWLKSIMGEFEQDFSRAKWHEGYEQGKVDGLIEREKVTVPQYVADWIEECKNDDFHLFGAMEGISSNQKKLDYWFREDDNMELFARAWLDGYEVEKEKKYRVKLKNADISYSLLKCSTEGKWWFGIDFDGESHAHTRKQIEEAGFGDVFNSPLFEVEEVEE